MPETDVDPGALDSIASRLRNASADLESTELPPEVPEAGDASGILASILTHVTLSLDGAVVCLGAAGDAVASSRDVFVEIEDANRSIMNSQLPE